MNASYQGSVEIWDGAVTDGQSGAYKPQTLNGFNVCNTPSLANAFAISSDHQDNVGPTHPTTLNGAIFNFPNNMFNFDRAPAALTAGQNSSLFAEDGSGSDCWLWGMMGLYYQTTNCNICSPCTTTFAHIDSIKNTSACMSSDGAIYISDSTTAPPVSYSWSNGATTQSITGLSAGNYSVTITDASGCTIIFATTISSPSAISISIDTLLPVSCGGNTGEIQVSASGGNPPYSYLWSTGATTQNINGLPYGIFSVTVTDASGCTAMLSVSDMGPTNFPTSAICMVTVDTLSQYNVIIWDKTPFAQTDSFIISREISTNNYQPLGTVPYTALSLFVDTVRVKYFPNTGDPNSGTYRYKITVQDSCGGKSALSNYHNTIYIINNGGVFSWPQLYTIENTANPVNSYVLMRDDFSNGNWHAVNSVSGTQQLVVDPNYSSYQSTGSWRVVTNWNITCTPTIKNPAVNSNYISSLSNIYKGGTGVNEMNNEITISVYPNPTTGLFTITSSEKITSVEVSNIVGEKVTRNVIPSGASLSAGQAGNLTIDISNQPQGIYFLKANTSEGIIAKKVMVAR